MKATIGVAVVGSAQNGAGVAAEDFARGVVACHLDAGNGGHPGAGGHVAIRVTDLAAIRGFLKGKIMIPGLGSRAMKGDMGRVAASDVLRPVAVKEGTERVAMRDATGMEERKGGSGRTAAKEDMGGTRARGNLGIRITIDGLGNEVAREGWKGAALPPARIVAHLALVHPHLVQDGAPFCPPQLCPSDPVTTLLVPLPIPIHLIGQQKVLPLIAQLSPLRKRARSSSGSQPPNSTKWSRNMPQPASRLVWRIPRNRNSPIKNRFILLLILSVTL